jgi:crotonobetainyl-CoA:carnitine CoA-transferase CaiB-like acyl-CoA transferase
MTGRAGNAKEVVALLDRIFGTKPRAERLAILRAGGDFIVTPLNTVDDLPDDPQVIANQYVMEFDHPAYGPTKVVGVPVRLSETPGALRRPAPEFGQHTEEILTDILGYSWEKVGRLREAEVI